MLGGNCGRRRGAYFRSVSNGRSRLACDVGGEVRVAVATQIGRKVSVRDDVGCVQQGDSVGLNFYFSGSSMNV